MKRLGVLALLGLFAGCTDDSFVVVSVLAYSGTLDDVAQFRVHASNAASEGAMLYPQSPSASIHLDTNRPVTFSVEFDSSRSGQATFEVEAMSKAGKVLAYGKSSVALNRNSIAPVLVKVVPGAVRPERPLDGDENMSCSPYAPAEACGTERTCGILCTTDKPAVAMCYAAGAGSPGDSCTSNADCGSGSQCLTFTATGCNVMTCLRFCQNDSACGQSDSYCNVPIQCGSSAHFAACSRPCDPTVATNNRCATGLSCFVYSLENTDCACPGLGSVGASCTQNSGCNGETGCLGCAAGLSCVIPTGADAGANTGVCRPVCKLAAPSCPSGTSCHAFDNSSRRLYGFCQ